MLVVVTILAWGFATRPYWTQETSRVVVSRQQFLSTPRLSGYDVIGGGIYQEDDNPRQYYFNVERSRLNPALYWPGIALLAFGIGKAFGLRRRTPLS